MQITDGAQVKEGSAGYIVSLDLTDYDVSDILGVQCQTTAGAWSDPVISEVAYDVLSGYVDDSECPDVAYTWMRNSLYVFVKDTYTYEDTTIVNFWYYRNAQNIDSLLDDDTNPVLVDIPGEMEQLALSLILRKLYMDKNISLPQNIGQQIRIQSNNLNIKYPV
jgi:hypothetical protein